MKRSILSAAIGVGVIVLNVAMLPTVPVSAQSSGASGSSDSGNSNGGNTTTGSSAAPGSSTSDPSASPSAAATGDASNTNEGPSNWGLIGLLGLVGLIPLFRRPARSAVGINRTEPLQNDPQATSDRLHQGLAQVGTGSRNLVEEIKTNVSDFQERRAQEKEIQNIKNALGRPSKRVILDRQDNVILNVGDLITNQAIEHARAADMLDVLFNSVDEREPEIANEDHIAPVAGETSLEGEQRNNINSRRQ